MRGVRHLLKSGPRALFWADSASRFVGLSRNLAPTRVGVAGGLTGSAQLNIVVHDFPQRKRCAAVCFGSVSTPSRVPICHLGLDCLGCSVYWLHHATRRHAACWSMGSRRTFKSTGRHLGRDNRLGAGTVLRRRAVERKADAGVCVSGKTGQPINRTTSWRGVGARWGREGFPGMGRSLGAAWLCRHRDGSLRQRTERASARWWS